MPGWITHLFAATLVLGLLAATPALGQGADDGPPAVDLRHISVTDNGATAPMVDGGVARLTLEPDLQRASERLLARAAPERGAVVIDARSGRVLAWAEHGASRPGAVLLDAQAPSASVFKIVTTAALLEHAQLSTSKRVCYSGGDHAIERRHLHAPHGGPDVRCTHFGLALGYSINAVYAQLVTRYLMREIW